MKAVMLGVIALFAVQMMVVWLITAANRQFFANRTAAEYPQAVAELSKHRPGAGFAIKACYAASLIELLAVWAYTFF